VQHMDKQVAAGQRQPLHGIEQTQGHSQSLKEELAPVHAAVHLCAPAVLPL
jgi:hypothetical protein